MTTPPAAGGPTWDGLADGLTAQRRRSGDPSYADIARRVTEQRIARGASPDSARVARTTVYDCFRPGRSRVNLALVREIAQVLGTDDGAVEAWMSAAPATGAPGPTSGPGTATSGPPAPTAPVTLVGSRPRPAQLALLLAGCVAVNLLGRVVVDFLDLPIFLDMLGTAIVAIALGPWLGVLVGGATNVLGALTSGLVSLPFALVNAVGALVWGYGVRRLDLGRTLPRFLLLNVLAALACSAVAVPILMAVGGSTGHGSDSILQHLEGLTQSLGAAVSASNVLVSLADKLICGFLALVAISTLPLALRRGVRLTLLDPGPTPPVT